MDSIEIKIGRRYQNYTVEEYFLDSGIGKGRIAEIKRTNSCFVNGEPASLDYRLKIDDRIELKFEEKINFSPCDLPLDILYEDDYLLIVNKPCGILIHPDGINVETTLANRVAAYYYSIKLFREVRYIHRIDVETTGIVLFAKDFITYSRMIKQIEDGTFERNYLALCHHHFKTRSGIIDEPIGRDRHAPRYRVSRSLHSKRAITEYEVVKEYPKYALVKLKLSTGRTHQIRVHMSYMHHPLLGDTLYGGSKERMDRVALHSSEVRFIHPIGNEFVSVQCPLPSDMERWVKK